MAPLAKQGTYTGLFGWNLSSAAHELEEGHVVTQDSYDGTFFNDDGDGFLHEDVMGVSGDHRHSQRQRHSRRPLPHHGQGQRQSLWHLEGNH